MKNSLKILLSLFSILWLCASCAEYPTFARENDLQGFFQKSEVTIAITDSGLGGLSILADAVQRSQNWKGFKKINFIYYNALFSNQGGYNTLEDHQEKVFIFDSALRNLEDSFKPDLILIGCNTLSAIYDDTNYAKQARTPVRGIIEAGVHIVSEALRAYPDSQAILFATQTTVTQNTHKHWLQNKGFLPERILYQVCPELAKHIETNYSGDETEMLIFAYVDEALQQIKDRNANLIVSFNCTHYGYSLALWKKAFRSLGNEPVAFLNPNPRMIDFLFRPQYQDRFSTTQTSVRVVSMVEIGKEKMETLGSLLHPHSPKTVKALQTYEWKKDLFEWQNFTKNRENE
jgi:glutamate racemase